MGRQIVQNSVSYKDMSLMTLGERVKYIRKLRGLTQSELGRMAGSHQQQIARIEKGETEEPKNLENIAKALNVSPYILEYGFPGEVMELAKKISSLNIQHIKDTESFVDGLLLAESNSKDDS